MSNNTPRNGVVARVPYTCIAFVRKFLSFRPSLSFRHYPSRRSPGDGHVTHGLFTLFIFGAYTSVPLYTYVADYQLPINSRVTQKVARSLGPR